MQFYRNYKRPKAIGFDLDDTLYDNRPVLITAEKALHKFLITSFPNTASLTINDWTNIRSQLVQRQPALKHDVSLARLHALKIGLQASGYQDEESTLGSKQALTHFLKWRNKIDITPDVYRLLKDLSKQFTLFVISNGNADIKQLGLDEVFSFALKPSLTIPMKPAADLFQQAQYQLQLSDRDILYVGDHPVSDIVGSNNMKWQSAWFNPRKVKLDHYKKPLQLPTFELSSITELNQLLK